MKKPHEQEWRREETPYGKGTRVVVRDERGRTVAEFPAFDPTSRDARWANAGLTQAAPDMARALLAQGRFLDAKTTRWHTETCLGNGEEACEPECIEAQTALRKAGVLP